MVDSKHTRLESLAVELVRNIASGKYFILLEDKSGSANFLLITPTGKVRQIERRLFGLPNIFDQMDQPVYTGRRHNGDAAGPYEIRTPVYTVFGSILGQYIRISGRDIGARYFTRRWISLL